MATSTSVSDLRALRTPMERAPQIDLGTALIPKERYTDSAFAALEWDRMFTRVWLLAGLESDIPEAGDYFTFEIGTESVLVIRQEDGSVRARHNVCMHRGNRLREPGLGHVERFSCLYHGWQYGIDGKLVKALDPECFPQGANGEALDLQPVLCDTWGGFVFVNLCPEAEPLTEYLGIIPEHLDPYHFDEWRITHDLTIEVDCNWKTSVDAFNEAYHVNATHPETLEFTDDVNVPIDCYPRHTRMIFREAIASPRHPGHGTLTPLLVAFFLKPAGVDVESLSGDPDEARKAMADAIRKQGPELGCDFREMNDSQMVDDFHYTLFPNITFNIHSRFLWVFRHRPHPDDPNKMFFDVWNLVRAPAQDIIRPEHEEHVLTDDFTVSSFPGGEILDQDLFNMPRIQKGMRSSRYPGLHLGTQEVRIRHFHHTLDAYIGE